MALDAEAVVVAGTGHLWVAPVGSTLPAPNSDPTADPDTAFAELGYTSTDGVTVTSTADISEFEAWQATTAIRRSRRVQVQEMTADLLEWNENTVVAAFGGGEVTSSGGFYTYTFPVAGEALKEYAVVLDVQDGERNMRIVIPRMNSGLEDVETQFNKENMAVLPITLRSLAADDAPYVIFDDAAAFAAAS